LKEKRDEEPLIDSCAADGGGATVSFGAKGENAYTGEIMDSTCAKIVIMTPATS
jgi:hypothetical protein